MDSKEATDSNLFVKNFLDICESNKSSKVMDLNGNCTTFDEILELSDYLSRKLLLEFGPQKRHVFIDATKKIEVIVVLISIWRLEWSYSFFDSVQPIDRILAMLNSSGTSLIFNLKDPHNLKFPSFQTKFNHLGYDIWAKKPNLYELNLDTCYVMFTSGSTGMPKGVPITHSQVTRFAEWMTEEFCISHSDTMTNVNPLYFDNSVFDLYVALFSGANLIMVDVTRAESKLDWISQLAEMQPTVWFSVPSLLILLQSVGAFEQMRFKSLRLIIFGGEAYPKAALRSLINDQGSQTMFFSVYGPTEGTCICSITKVTEAEMSSPLQFISLGNFASFFGFGLMSGFITQDGHIAGELVISGPNVSSGYSDRVLTHGKFFNGLASESGDYSYLTGDIVSFSPELGRLCFLGRADNQVKRLGVRIELEEIEARLERDISCRVIADFDSTRQEDLCLVVELHTTLTQSHFKSQINLLLPVYMRPKKIYFVKNLPSNANGKKDRKKAKFLVSPEVIK
jgi:D-alanine--poly(phosphoribitol) ligase subunit 1